MIELKGVTRRFGQVEAVKNVSLTAPDGQIVGLLGVNGAGKTTTLRMMAGTLPPTSGQILIGGMDLMREPRVRRLIGYLPERVPLYDEMTVREYLMFAASLREVERRDARRHVEEIMDLCGLTDVEGRVLGHLSKGYRQRAGIAQALCGNSATLILDEPTVGLDPRQVSEIRQLIREIGKSHTIIFSSHILSEVEQLCRKVVILHHGKVLRVVDMEDEGKGEAQHLRLRVRGEERRICPAIRSLPGVLRVRPVSRDAIGCIDVNVEYVDAGEIPMEEKIFHLLSAMDAPIYQMVKKRESLEEMFLQVTREEEAE
ncbi:MAG: ABC transporter ATP-binding protein [Clostridia bacterium]|nr:ABC transporter ATP-binding protein [Clostridia bacterium]